MGDSESEADVVGAEDEPVRTDLNPVRAAGWYLPRR